MDTFIFIIKIILFFVMACLAGKFYTDKKVRELFARASFISMVFVIIFAVMEVADRVNFVNNDMYTLKAIDILAGLSVICIVVFVVDKFKNKSGAKGEIVEE